MPSGESHSLSQVSDEMVVTLRHEYAQGKVSFTQLGAKFNLSRHVVTSAVTLPRATVDPIVPPVPSLGHSDIGNRRKQTTFKPHPTRSPKAMSTADAERWETNKAAFVVNAGTVRRALALLAAGRTQLQVAVEVGSTLIWVSRVATGKLKWVTPDMADDALPPMGPRDLATKAETGEVRRVIVTVSKAKEIHHLRQSGLTYPEIGAQVGIYPNTCSLIARGVHPIWARLAEEGYAPIQD